MTTPADLTGLGPTSTERNGVTCPACGTTGRFDVVRYDCTPDKPGDGPQEVSVLECAACGARYEVKHGP